MTNYNDTAVSCESTACFFIGVYKDHPEDTWFNVCFVNNSGKGIKSLKIESVEIQHTVGEGNRALAAATGEYEDIYHGDYLLIEKLDSWDERVNEYRYSFTIDIEGKLINLCSHFSRENFLKRTLERVIPVIKENGMIYLCT